MSTAFDLEVARHVGDGWVVINKTDDFAQLSKAKSKSCLLIIILLLFGILPGILYLLIPAGKDVITIWAKDSAVRQAQMTERHEAEVARLAKIAERRAWQKAHPVETRAAFIKNFKHKATILVFVVVGALIMAGGFVLLSQIARIGN